MINDKGKANTLTTR